MNAALSPKFLSAFSLSLLFGTTAGTGTRPVAEGTASSPRAASSKNTFVFLNGRFLSEGADRMVSGTHRIRQSSMAARSASTPRPTARPTAPWSGTESFRATPLKQRIPGPASVGIGTSRKSIGTKDSYRNEERWERPRHTDRIPEHGYGQKEKDHG